VANDYPGLLEPARRSTQPTSVESEDASASPPRAAPKRTRKPKKDDRQSSLF
jgi:hypothetical protein